METINLKLPGQNDFFTQEAYKVLRTNLQFCGQDIKVIAITSCNENEGKSTVSLHLGKSFAELGKKVLVVDADMRKSVIAGRNTSARAYYGLSEVLTGMKESSDCIYSVNNLSMNILFAGQYPPNPVELLSGQHFSNFVTENREIYDYIIIDTPPLGQVIDAAVIAKNCDGAVLVLGDSKIHYKDAKVVVDTITKSGCKMLGVIRNGQQKISGKTYYKKYYKHNS